MLITGGRIFTKRTKTIKARKIAKIFLINFEILFFTSFK